MLNKLINTLYLRIRVAGCLAKLEDIEGVKDQEVYLQRMQQICTELSKIPAAGTDLLLSMKDLISHRDINGLQLLTRDIRLFLDAQYLNSAIKRPLNPARKIFPLAVIILLVLFSILSYGKLKDRYINEKELYDNAANEELYKARTLKDILDLKKALQIYYDKNKSYPKSSGGWDAVVANYGESRQDWIRGLAPGYIKILPADPRQSKDPGQQYMYNSDGTNYKLIAHHPAGIEEIIKMHPDLVDPARPSWAFGVWTEGAKNW
jgi:hypothetical protein